MPHETSRPLHAGTALSDATGALVLVHGRGALAESILALAPEIVGDGVAVLAPQAETRTWYPHSFLAPLAANAPWLADAVDAVLRAVALAEAAGVPRARIAVGGFSQGACLALEAVARAGGRWAGAFALSGGLIGRRDIDGAPPFDKAFDYPGRLAGTPVFIGGSDVDPHIPLARMEQSADALRAAGATVELRVYPGLGHTVSPGEIQAVREMLAPLGEDAPSPTAPRR